MNCKEDDCGTETMLDKDTQNNKILSGKANKNSKMKKSGMQQVLHHSREPAKNECKIA